MSIELNGVTIDMPVYGSGDRSLRRSITAAAVGGKLFARNSDNKVVIRALDAVSLKIQDGQRVGLIGPNGAGKTTMLRVMAGIYTPTSGVAHVSGRISSALNTGLGLDLELSGRENIYLLGYYRGLTREQIDAEFDAIVEAADLGHFINLPMLTYSSGMMGRLTFSVATSFQPDVLLMDEWLLAGDARFMRAAAKRTASFVSQARIMVLASHGNAIIREFCTHAAYLSAGRLIAYGPADEVIGLYEADVEAGAV